jgi:hypothetical protein
VKSRRLDGPRLHFDKGFWLRGENERLDNGTHAVAFAPELKIGWQFWLDGEPGDEVTGLLSQGFQPPPRSSLGDMDKTLWERKADGTPKDPWSKVNLLPLVLPKTNEVCTYTTTSKGGFAAVGELCEAFDTAPPDMLPLIALEADSYTHKEFGRVWVPVLKVLKYVPAARFNAMLASVRGGSIAQRVEELEPTPELDRRPMSRITSGREPPPSEDDGPFSGVDPDDSIPF